MPDKPAPPVSLTSVNEIGGALELKCLWTLSYIRNNAIKFTLLKLPLETSVDEAVNMAKDYCINQSWRFSWLEKTVVELAKPVTEKPKDKKK